MQRAAAVAHRVGRWPWELPIVLCMVLMHLVASALIPAFGHLSVDEVGYHWATKSIADGRPWAISNGYEETPSRELEVTVAKTIMAHGGRLYGKYPVIFPLLAAPLYGLLGFRALFLLNSAAFAIVLILTWRLACRYLESAWALAASAVFGLATFAWEYGQAAWPHMTALAFALGGMLLAFGVPDEERPGRAALRVLAAGLLLGVAIGIRLDAAFLLGATALILLLARPVRPAAVALLGLGALPGLLALAADSYRKYGVFLPFFYGPGTIGLRPFIPMLAAAALLGAAVAAVLALGRVAPHLGRRTRVLVVVAAALVLLVVFPRAGRNVLMRLRNTFAVVVDMNRLDPARVEPAMVRTDHGGVVYIGHYKKALLQSAPYLTLLVAFALRKRREGEGRRTWALFVPVAVMILAYGPTAWHGGLCLNQRYLLPAFPFTSVLTVLVLRDLWPAPGRRAAWGAALAWLAPLVVVALLCARAYFSEAGPRESFMSHGPAALGLLVGLAVLVFYLDASRPRRVTRAVALAAIGAAMGWSAATAFLYDFPATARHRATNHVISSMVAEKLEPGSIVFVPVIDAFAGLIDKDVRVANPWQDSFQMFRGLAGHYLDRGRAAYLVANDGQMEWLSRAGILQGIRMHDELRIGRLLVSRIDSLPPAPSPPEEPGPGAPGGGEGDGSLEGRGHG